MTPIEQAKRHLHLAAEALDRADFAGAAFHVDMARRKARLEERVRRRDYDIEVLWKTDRQDIQRRLIRVRSTSIEHAHQMAQAAVAEDEQLEGRPVQSHLIT